MRVSKWLCETVDRDAGSGRGAVDTGPGRFYSGAKIRWLVDQTAPVLCASVEFRGRDAGLVLARFDAGVNVFWY